MANKYDYNETKKFFSTKLRDLMKEKSINQSQLADILNGISRQAVSRWVKGESIPDMLSILRIAEYFDVSLDYLFGMSHGTNINEDVKAISRYTGLDTKSVEMLHILKGCEGVEIFDILKYLITGTNEHNINNLSLLSAILQALIKEAPKDIPKEGIDITSSDFNTHRDYYAYLFLIQDTFNSIIKRYIKEKGDIDI